MQPYCYNPLSNMGCGREQTGCGTDKKYRPLKSAFQIKIDPSLMGFEGPKIMINKDFFLCGLKAK